MTTQTRTSTVLTLAAAITAALFFTASSANADLIGELGILDPVNANGGTNPATGDAWAEGDTYRLIFITGSKTYPATSSNIADYNTHVTSVANGAGLGGNWFAVGSTATVDARDNSSTNPGVDPDMGIFLLDGITKVADDNNDLWNGPDTGITFDENLNIVADLGPVTGSNGNGTSLGAGSRVLGGSSESPPRVRIGRNTVPGQWMVVYNTAAANNAAYYGISDTLTLMAGPTVPEPTTFALAVFGLLGLVGMRRRRRR